jgi:hypothetical protein
MFALDPEVLSTAKAARERMLERQHELERARADLNHEIRRLHAAGGSMREISEQLGVSHQRVHQIVAEGDDAEPEGVIRRLTDRLRALGGSFERFGDEARTVVVQAQSEAKQLGAKAVGPEHLLLALTTAQAGESARLLTEAGVGHDALRAALERPTSGPSPRRTPFSAASKRALEAALREAQARGEHHLGSAVLLRGVLGVGSPELEAALTALGVSRASLRDALDAR